MVRMSGGHLWCVQTIRFKTNKESSIWRQNDHAKFLSVFHLSRRVSDKNGACSISIRFFKITDPFAGRSFLMCSHDPFFGTNKNRILKNGSCERALSLPLMIRDWQMQFYIRRATSHLTISMLGQRETDKIQRNNYYHVNCGPSLTSKTPSVSSIVTH